MSEDKSSKWASLKDRLAIGAVILFLLLFVLMVALDSVMNFQCSAWQFIMFECNRFDAEFKPWQ